VTYIQAKLLCILNQSPGTGTTANALLILADQLIAAKLNALNIAKCDTTAAAFCNSAIGAGDSLIGGTVITSNCSTFTYVKASSTAGKQMIDVGSQLNTCNNSCKATQ